MFMYNDGYTSLWGEPVHSYSLTATGIKMREKHFTQRAAATKAMYDFMGRKGIKLIKVYDDKHFKTYVCEHGIQFHINREDF